MGNMVVCSSLVIGAAKGGSRALNWIHPTWSTCAELHNVRERHLIRWGNKSNEQLCSACHTQQAQGRKEGRKEQRKQEQAPALSCAVPAARNAAETRGGNAELGALCM